MPMMSLSSVQVRKHQHNWRMATESNRKAIKTMKHFEEYNLIKSSESNELFELQQALLKDKSLSLDEKVTRLAILLITNPIGDYQTAINLLNDYVVDSSSSSFQVLVSGAFMNALCPLIEPNPFITRLNEIYSNCNLEQKSIIRFIQAIDIDDKCYGDESEINKVKSLLSEAIAMFDGFVYAYYRLALISERRAAKRLLKKALSNVKKVFSVDEIERLPMSEIASYDFFMKVIVVGTEQTIGNYNEMIKLYKHM